MYQHMKITNQDKAKVFAEYLGQRFETFEVASENAPISFLAKDFEGKEYYVHVQVANERSVTSREHSGIAIENAHFYQLYGMASQGMNVFWMEAFEDGYMLFYINDCLTPEQLNVLPEQTLIGVASALHVQQDRVKYDNKDGKTYSSIASSTKQPEFIGGSLDLNLPKAKVNKRKK
jgi:hypothetical protein